RNDRDLALRGGLDRGAHFARLRFVRDRELLDLLAAVFGQARGDGLAVLLRVGVDRPILAGLKARDLFLALADHAQRRALHASGGGARKARLLPQQRREIEADQIIERAPRLLRVDEVLGDGARLLDRLADRVARDLVEDDAVDVLTVERAVFLQQLGEMPGNRLALAVGVG